MLGENDGKGDKMDIKEEEHTFDDNLLDQSTKTNQTPSKTSTNHHNKVIIRWKKKGVKT